MTQTTHHQGQAQRLHRPTTVNFNRCDEAHTFLLCTGVCGTSKMILGCVVVVCVTCGPGIETDFQFTVSHISANQPRTWARRPNPTICCSLSPLLRGGARLRCTHDWDGRRMQFGSLSRARGGVVALYSSSPRSEISEKHISEQPHENCWDSAPGHLPGAAAWSNPSSGPGHATRYVWQSRCCR